MLMRRASVEDKDACAAYEHWNSFAANPSFLSLNETQSVLNVQRGHSRVSCRATGTHAVGLSAFFTFHSLTHARLWVSMRFVQRDQEKPRVQASARLVQHVMAKVYGECPIPAVSQLVQDLRLREDDIFLDLGSDSERGVYRRDELAGQSAWKVDASPWRLYRSSIPTPFARGHGHLCKQPEVWIAERVHQESVDVVQGRHSYRLY
jgi:hypothetical protein